MRKVMITGVNGLIGGAIYDRLIEQPERYDVYGLDLRRGRSDRVPEDWPVDIPEEKFTLSDLSDLDGLTRAANGMEVVIHMAADPDPEAEWESILNNNLIGTYHLFEASRRAGVRRVIFASSGQTVIGYGRREPYRAIAEEQYEAVPDPIPIVTHTMPTHPLNIYGCSKVWGEALARIYADAHGMSCICIRCGWVNKENRPWAEELKAAWCSHRDIVQIFERCIDAPSSLQFDILYGVSNNRYRWVDTSRAAEMVGYQAKDRAEDYL